MNNKIRNIRQKIKLLSVAMASLDDMSLSEEDRILFGGILDLFNSLNNEVKSLEDNLEKDLPQKSVSNNIYNPLFGQIAKSQIANVEQNRENIGKFDDRIVRRSKSSLLSDLIKPSPINPALSETSLEESFNISDELGGVEEKWSSFFSPRSEKKSLRDISENIASNLDFDRKIKKGSTRR